MKNQNKLKFHLIFLLLSIFIGLVTYVSYRNYISYKQQKKLFADLNRADYSNTNSEFYSKLEVDLPNVTFTSIPIKALKAMYYFENEPDSLRYVKSLLKKSIVDNPYLKFSEGNLSQIYFAEKKYDSAYYYARNSFEGIPINAVHFAMMSKLYANRNNIDSIISSFEKINKKPLVDISRVFFASMNNFYSKINDTLLKNKVFEFALNAKKRFRNDKDLQLLVDNILFSKDSINKAIKLEDTGSKLLTDGKMKQGIEYFEKALAIREENIPYIQTLALAYYNIGDHKKSIEYFEKMIKNGIGLDPLSLYVMGINSLNTRKYSEGCDYLNQSRRFGQKDAALAYSKYCDSKN